MPTRWVSRQSWRPLGDRGPDLTLADKPTHPLATTSTDAVVACDPQPPPSHKPTTDSSPFVQVGEVEALRISHIVLQPQQDRRLSLCADQEAKRKVVTSEGAGDFGR